MTPGAFEYHAPNSVAEAVSLLEQHGDSAKLLAGGHSLLPLMKLRFAQPEVIIDLAKISDLSYIRQDGGGLAIGAMTTYTDIETSSAVQSVAPALSEAAGMVADRQVRNMGTIGGCLAHADPAGDLPAVILALGAQIVTSSNGPPPDDLRRRFLCGLLHHGTSTERNHQRDTDSRPGGRHRNGLCQIRQ